MNCKIAYLEISELKYTPHIYHSPQVPGWVAWATVVQLRNGDVLVGLNEVTGNLNRNKPGYLPEIRNNAFPHDFYNMEELDKKFKIIRAIDKGPWFSKWESYFEETWGGPWPPEHRLLLQTGKGTLLRETQGRRIPQKSYPCRVISRSEDNGKTWDEYEMVHDADKWQIAFVSRVIQLRDERLVMAAYGLRKGAPAGSQWLSSYLLISEDDGKNWSEPVDVIISDGDTGFAEPVIVELSNGDILMMLRVEVENASLDAWDAENNTNRNRKQVRLIKSGNTWVSGEVEQLEIPHGGHPELLMTREGLLLYSSPEGFWGSVNEGQEWTRIKTLPYALYYPSSVQLDDGRIFVVGHNAGDCAFPPPEDMAIWKISFRINGIKK
jgi:BNR repeat-like domain